jgi:hypothetical protein
MLAGLQRHAGPNGRIASGDLRRIVAEKTSYGPQILGRRLRELAEEGKLDVRHVRDHAHDRLAQIGGRNSALEGGLAQDRVALADEGWR